jgi:uroporphyrin-III C-methyltransferase
VIYTGVTGVTHIQHELLHGLAGHTPVAVIQHASLPNQRHVATTLARLPLDLGTAGLGSPAVIVVGDVLRGLAAAGLPAARFGT